MSSVRILAHLIYLFGSVAWLLFISKDYRTNPSKAVKLMRQEWATHFASPKPDCRTIHDHVAKFKETGSVKSRLEFFTVNICYLSTSYIFITCRDHGTTPRVLTPVVVEAVQLNGIRESTMPKDVPRSSANNNEFAMSKTSYRLVLSVEDLSMCSCNVFHCRCIFVLL